MAFLTPQAQQQLIEAALNGDQAAFQSLYAFLAPMLRHTLARVSPEDCLDDVVQETISKSFQRMHQFRQEASFSSWCVRIGIHEALTERRRRKREEQYIVGSTDNIGFSQSGGLRQMALKCIDPAYERQVTHDLIHSAIAEILLEDRRLAMLMRLEGFSIRNIAESLDRPVGTIKATLSRGKEDVRRTLERRGWDDAKKTEPK